MKAIFLALVLVSVNSEIVYFVEVCRHGARSPSDMMPWDEGRWPMGESILTTEGMRQHYIIGVHLRKRYIIDNKLLPEFYIPSSILLVSSTKERAIRSLESQLLGLYPTWNYKPLNNVSLPINYNPDSLDLGVYVPTFSIEINQIDPMIHSDDQCPDFKIFQKKRKKSKRMKKIYKKYQDIVKTVQSRFQLPEHDAEEMVLDIIGSIRCNQFAGYDWDPAFDEDFIKRAQSLYMETKNYANYAPDYSARFAASDFFNSVTEQFREVKGGKMARKGSIYSAHDTTLFSIFATLGLNLKVQPPFASVLLFEILKENNEFYIRILYNMNPVIVPGCPQEDKCGLNYFLDYIKGRAFNDTKAACKQFASMKVESEDFLHVEFEPNEFTAINTAIVIAEVILISVIFYHKIKRAL